MPPGRFGVSAPVMALSFRRLCARTGCASNVECRRLKWRVAGDGWRRSGKRARESGTPPASLGAAGAPVGDRLKPHLRRARSGIPNRLTLACIQSRRPAGAPPAWSAGSGCSTCVQSAVARDQWPVWEGELCGDRLSPAPGKWTRARDGRTPGNGQNQTSGNLGSRPGQVRRHWVRWILPWVVISLIAARLVPP